MKIAFDTRPLHNQSAHRGIGVVTAHLLKYLRQLPDIEVIEVKSDGLPGHVDLVHYPWFDLYFPTLPLLKNKPTVVTIHDVTPLVLADLYPVGIKGRINFQLQKLALRNVAAVITDSEVSRQDIIKYLPVAEDKVYTVHLAPQDGLTNNFNDTDLSVIKEKYHLPDQYVLYVGDINRIKNLLSLVKACKQINIKLIIVGKQALVTDFDRQHVENHDLLHLQADYGDDPLIQRVGFVPSEELSAVYQLATVYCQPSLYEGFGVPILEAMQCGCPVVAAKRGSLPEIGGQAAIYTEPTPKNLSTAIQLVLNLSPAQRKRLIQEGHQQTTKFSWSKTAQQVAQIYRQILGHSHQLSDKQKH